uniref:Uncharacterized protein n=1 Tax=Panagrolaimus sp. JU765 TaxID=591449 RepID=A0AC34QGX0_9BILA
MFGSGLYLALVSIVTVVIVLAFCLVGTDEQTEPTVAKQMWSKSRQTLRRYTIRQPRQRGPKIVASLGLAINNNEVAITDEEECDLAASSRWLFESMVRKTGGSEMWLNSRGVELPKANFLEERSANFARPREDAIPANIESIRKQNLGQVWNILELHR